MTLDDELVGQLTAEQRRVQHHKANHSLAVYLDTICQRKSVIVDGKFHAGSSLRDYRTAFADAGYRVETQNPLQTAEAIRESPINESLVAALDDWALVSLISRKFNDCKRILKLAAPGSPKTMTSRPARSQIHESPFRRKRRLAIASLPLHSNKTVVGNTR